MKNLKYATDTYEYNVKAMNKSKIYDVVIIGGGYAGLSAALWLGRFRRSAIVLSAGPSRNAASHVIHGYPGYDGDNPAKLLSKIHHEAARYGTDSADAKVTRIQKRKAYFVCQTSDQQYLARRVLVATGVDDIAPEIPDFAAFVGVSAWQCPACDGHEYMGRRIVIIGWGPHIAGYAQEFLTYTSDILVLTHDHPSEVTTTDRATLQACGIPVIDTQITALQARPNSRTKIKSLRLLDGADIPADAVFYSIKHCPRLELLEQLGCDMAEGAVTLDDKQQTSTPGVYAAGDISPREELAVVACASGTIAAHNIHTSLQTLK